MKILLKQEAIDTVGQGSIYLRHSVQMSQPVKDRITRLQEKLLQRQFSIEVEENGKLMNQKTDCVHLFSAVPSVVNPCEGNLLQSKKPRKAECCGGQKKRVLTEALSFEPAVTDARQGDPEFPFFIMLGVSVDG